MQASNLPPKIPHALTSVTGTLINSIPDTTTNSGYFSWTNGYTAPNETPLNAGGVPPRIQDNNGLAQIFAAWCQWQATQGPIFYDPAFSSVIGGYPLGSILHASAIGMLWLNTVDNNTTNPESGNVGWRQVFLVTGSMAQFTSTGSWTAPVGVSRVRARLWGAGGGATGSNTGANLGGIGGGGGGYAEAYVIVNPGTSYPVTVGAGGAGGTGSGYPSGAAGGSTSFGGVTAYGGGGATAFTSAGSGGATAGGTTNVNGGPGAFGAAAGTTYFGGYGGTAFGSAPYPTTAVGALANGYGGTFPGAGGTSGVYGGSGGAGAGGLVILEW